ncbi:MAG: hypothetical protein QOH64_1305 [Acidimicrobiaceae bacterium]
MYVGVPGGGAPGGPTGGGGSVTCQLHDFAGPTGGGGPIVGPGELAQPPFVEGQSYIVVCTNDAGETVYAAIITYQPGISLVDAITLARQAYRELPLLYPDPHTSPPFNTPQLVGMRTWLWIDEAQWHDQSATAAVLGLSATATAHPTKVIWDLGDGTTVTCLGPGIAYDTARPPAEQHTDCSHVYQRSGAYDVTATIVWEVTWTASNGAGGSLAPLQRGTGFPVPVEQRQAVITNG